MKEIEGLSKQQILQGFEDLCTHALKWDSCMVIVNRGIAGMIMGTPEFVNMMKSAAEGKATLPITDLN